MDNHDLKNELMLLLEKEVGETGPSILKKQCKDLGIDLESITPYDITRIADRILEVIRFYTGDERAVQIKEGMSEYGDALQIVTASHGTVANKINAYLLIADRKLFIGLADEAEAAINTAKSLIGDLDPTEKVMAQARVNRYMGRVLSRNRKRTKEAMAEFKNVTVLGKERGLHYDVALAWNGMGAMAWGGGKHKKALEYYTKALDNLRSMGAESIKDKLKKRNVEAKIKSGLGNVYLDLLNIDEAIKYNEDAIGIFKELGNWGEVGRVYNNLARVYEEIGKYDDAIERYELGLEHSKGSGTLRMRGWTMTNLSSTFIEAGQIAKALPILNSAEEILAEFNDPIAHSKLHCMYGKYYRELGEWSKGIEHFQKSINSMKGVKSPDYLAIAEEEFGTLYQKMGEDKKARKLLESALAWYEKKEEANRINKIKKQLKALKLD